MADHSKFFDTQLLKIVKDNFPHILEPYRSGDLLSSGSEWTEEQRMQLRKAGLTMTTTIDGDTYWPPGGGVVTSGDSMEALDKGRQTIYFYEQAENKIRSAVLNFIEMQPEDRRGYFDNLKLKMNNLITGTISVTDFDIKLNVELYHNDDATQFIKTTVTQF